MKHHHHRRACKHRFASLGFSSLACTLSVLYAAAVLPAENLSAAQVDTAAFCDQLTGKRLSELRKEISDLAMAGTPATDKSFLIAKARLQEVTDLDTTCRAAKKPRASAPGNQTPNSSERGTYADPAASDTDAVRQALINDQLLLNHHRLERSYAEMLVMGMKPNHPDMRTINKQLQSSGAAIAGREDSRRGTSLCNAADKMMLKERRTALLGQLQSLISNGYGPKHPDVIAQQNKIAHLAQTAAGARPC